MFLLQNPGAKLLLVITATELIMIIGSVINPPANIGYRALVPNNATKNPYARTPSASDAPPPSASDAPPPRVPDAPHPLVADAPPPPIPDAPPPLVSQALPPSVSDGPSVHPSKKSKGKKTAIGVSVSVFVLVALLGSGIYYRRRRQIIEEGRRGNQKLLFSPETSASFQPSRPGIHFSESGTNSELLPYFDLSSIVSATENFSVANKLGQGGFGMVYKGRLNNGQEIAVKRLSKNSGQGVKEFKTEVTLITKLQHRNLVRLLGYCIQKEEKMLVYEYLPNKGLDSFIFDRTKGALLDWKKRFNIMLGIARGLLYLHQDSRLRIIHRDMKASNVLLDMEMNPKISDFGMAKIFNGDQIEANTNRVVGTYGYMSPEYAMEGLFSVKSDVFSFGVLLLEIISGRKNSSYYQEKYVNLIGHVWELWKEDRALEILDSSMWESCSAQQVQRCIHIGLLCVQELANDRPNMANVAFMLCNETALPSPKQPAFIFRGTSKPDTSSPTNGGKVSVNDVTVTMIEGR